MGFVASGPYLNPVVATLGPVVMTALATAADRLGGTQGDAAVLRWFGTNAAPFKMTLARDLRRMRSVMNVNTVTIGSEDLTKRQPDTNASAWPAAKRVGLGDQVRKKLGRSVFLDMNFRNLPRFLPMTGSRINAKGFFQSQLNTLVHELSHLLIGTADVTGARGYSLRNAECGSVSGSQSCWREEQCRELGHIRGGLWPPQDLLSLGHDFGLAKDPQDPFARRERDRAGPPIPLTYGLE